MIDLGAKVYVAGHRGMVGSAIVKVLERKGYSNITTRPRSNLDLTDQNAVRSFFEIERPEYVYLAAAKVGGIFANSTYPADFIYENLMIQANVIHESWKSGVKRLLFLGSSCIYPRLASQPMSEEALLTGPLEPTNEPYAVAKISGIKLCESYNRQFGVDFRSVMPTNLYGPGDNFHPENSHVIPALIRRFHEAKINNQSAVTIWGTGNSKREFIHVDDMADAAVFVFELEKGKYESITQPMLSHINVGVGTDISIRELALMISKVVGFEGAIQFDASQPEGSPRKLLDVSRLNKLGWTVSIDLYEGLKATYDWFSKNFELEN